MTLLERKRWCGGNTRFYGQVLATGVFDVLHRGHAEMLTQAAALGPLIVGLNSDDAVRRLKGPTRPVNNQEDRLFVVASLEVVRWVLLIDSDTVEGAILDVRPTIWVKSTPWSYETLNKDEVAACRKVGARIEILKALDGYSSTSVIERMSK